MSRLILNKAIENPMEIREESKEEHERLIYVGSEMFSDIGACVWSQDRWQLPELPERVNSRSTSEVCLVPYEPLKGQYSLVRDPDVRYFRIHLRYYVKKENCHEQILICKSAENSAEYLKLERGKSFDSAVKARLIACFQHGLDLDLGCWGPLGCTGRLVHHFLQAGKAGLPESALLEHGKSPEIIASILDDGKYCTIFDKLGQLRHSRNARKDAFYFRRWQRGLEWTEIVDLTSRFRKVILKKKPLPKPNPEVEGSLPAINGLGEGFWN
jgi:hypothetical protein